MGEVRMTRVENEIDRLFGVTNSAYNASRANDFRKVRSGINYLGTSADYHWHNESDFYRAIEYFRDMDRNDGTIGQGISRAVCNIIQGGFVPEPNTGDADLDAYLFDYLSEWGATSLCDVAGISSFLELQYLVTRSYLLDGDIFALLLDGAEYPQIQLIESHLCRSPGLGGNSTNGGNQIVLGVEMDAQRRRHGYWFAEDVTRPFGVALGSARYEARDESNEPIVLHIASRTRPTMTRGASVLAPVIDYAGMIEDINRAKLIQQQMASCIAVMRLQAAGNPIYPASEQFGAQSIEQQPDGSTRTVETLRPGIIIEGRPGETFQGFSPNVPNSEYFEQVQLILRIVAANMGLPLGAFLLDASSTNFNGFRGANDEARRGFARHQRVLVEQFLAPVARHAILCRMARSPYLSEKYKAIGEAVLRVKWRPPRWPYSQPEQDANADAIQLDNMTISPRRLHALRGADCDEIAIETVLDNEYAITQALEAMLRVEKIYGVRIDPARFLSLQPSTPLMEQKQK